MSPRTRLAAAAAALLFAASFASAQPSVGQGLGIRLLEAPVSRRNDPRALVYIVDNVKPGSSFKRAIEVANGTGRDLRGIQLYPAAASITNGAWTVGDGRAQNELTPWITVDPPTLDLANGARGKAEVTVIVPPGTSGGERYAVILAEAPKDPGANGVAVISRVGIRVYLSVSAGKEPPSDFVITSLTAERDRSGRPVVAVNMQNTGGRALDLNGEVTLKDGPGGVTAGPFKATLGTTLGIGQTAPVRVTLDPQIPAGPWRAVATMHSGRVTKTADATITFPSAPAATAEPTVAKPVAKKSSALPLVVGAVLACLALLAAVVVWRRRKPREPVVALPLDHVLTQLRTASGDRRAELMKQAAAYGREAIMSSPELASLPVQVARELGEQVARSGR